MDDRICRDDATLYRMTVTTPATGRQSEGVSWDADTAIKCLGFDGSGGTWTVARTGQEIAYNAVMTIKASVTIQPGDTAENADLIGFGGVLYYVVRVQQVRNQTTVEFQRLLLVLARKEEP